jgi:signal transduction histidine kinase
MDRPRLERAFENVLRNALQMSKRGGEVRVETRVLADAGRGWVECTIRDCGPGFAEEDLPKVFEPFFTRRSGGTGLGLPIVQRVLEQHGGSVTVGNHAQGGAVVVARLPVLAES